MLILSDNSVYSAKSGHSVLHMSYLPMPVAGEIYHRIAMYTERNQKDLVQIVYFGFDFEVLSKWRPLLNVRTANVNVHDIAKSGD